MREIFPMSAKMIAAVAKKEKKYPYEQLLMGQSFNVKHGDCTEGTLCNSAYLAGKKLGKRFRVIDHGKDIGFEVALIGLREPKSQATTEPTGAERFKNMGFKS